MENITVLDVFTDHQLIRSEKKCYFCHGSLFRRFTDGTITCVRCGTLIEKGKEEPKKS